MWTFPLFEALATFGQPPVMTGTARRRSLSRHYRNPKDPHQAARIEAAKRKRERKAAKLMWCTDESLTWNDTLDKRLPDWLTSPHNPFYIAK